MYNLFDKENAAEVLSRIEQLKPDTQARWGKMRVDQMLAHCSAALGMSMSQQKYPRSFIGILFGKMAKKSFVNQEPFRQNLPTDKRFMVANPEEFEKERAKLVALVKQFNRNSLSGHPHAFFGKLTAEEWSIGMHKHLDHHLQQFGV